MQDRCIRRYRSLYGSDDRIHACVTELGVPLTYHPGFHQFDVHGNVVGLLAAHPLAPLVSLHHLEKVFYYLSRWGMSNESSREIVTRYSRDVERRDGNCRWKLLDPYEVVEEVVVFKKADPSLWDRVPRRNCCRVIPSLKLGNQKAMAVEVGVCRDEEDHWDAVEDLKDLKALTSLQS